MPAQKPWEVGGQGSEPAAPDRAAAAASASPSRASLGRLPKAELEWRLEARSLSTQGTKQELVARLHAVLDADAGAGAAQPSEDGSGDASTAGGDGGGEGGAGGDPATLDLPSK